MIHYKIKLTKAEVEELHEIINKGLHTSHTFGRLYSIDAIKVIFRIK